MAEFERHFPENRGLQKALHTVAEAVCMRWLRWRLRGMSTGSPRWHSLQEKLGQGAAIGLAARLRNVFYEKTILGGCPEIHVLPQVAIYYPRNVRMGRATFINRGTYIVAPAAVTIGTNVLIGPYVVINSGSHRYADSTRPIREQGHKLEPIAIDDDVWIGAHSVIMPGVTLGKGCVVGAGSIVTKSVHPFHVVCGVPATRVLGQRLPPETSYPRPVEV